MNLSADHIGKKYNQHWLFRNVSFSLSSGESLAILGRNGAGKSTFLQIIYGLVQPTEGIVRLDGESNFEPHKHFAMTAPAMELPGDFTALELLDFYRKLGKLSQSNQAFMDKAYFSKEEMNRPLKYFSSGMGQRLKTALCLYSDAEILLLDEPLTNMDQTGEKWFAESVKEIHGKLCLVASNLLSEYGWTSQQIVLE